MANPKDSILRPLSAALVGVLAGAAQTGLLVRDAEARVVQPAVRRRDEESKRADPLLLIAPEHTGTMLIAGHSSHRSHSSHYSSRGGGGGGSTYDYDPTPAPAPPRAKPAHVSFVVYPGGSIFVDGKPAGRDATGQLKLSPGKHSVRISNRFLGEYTAEVDLADGDRRHRDQVVEPELIFSDGAIQLAIDTRLYRVIAVQKAGYKLAQRCTVVLGELNENTLRLALRFAPQVSERDALETARLFFQELLDQELRERVGEETHAVRSLLLAHAFSNSDLIKRD